MPRHLISDAHEWINEIPTVPIYYLAKPQPREQTESGASAPYFWNQAHDLVPRAIRSEDGVRRGV